MATSSAARMMEDLGGTQGAQLNPRSDEFLRIKHMLQVRPLFEPSFG